MKAEFKNLGEKFFGYPCITLERKGGEQCLASELGEIWYAGGDTLKAFKIMPSRREEKIFTFKIKDLRKWVLKLKVQSNPALMLKWANEPNLRLTR